MSDAIKQDDKGHYRVVRGAGGRFERQYLPQSEIGPTGPVGGIGDIGSADEIPIHDHQFIIPAIQEDEIRFNLPAGKRLVEENVRLINEIQRLSTNLYNFGQINENNFAELRDSIETAYTGDDEDIDEVVDTASYISVLSSRLSRAYRTARSDSPRYVMATHSSHTFYALQYLLGMVYPESAGVERSSGAVGRINVSPEPREVLSDLIYTYNIIQETLGSLGMDLVGVVPEEVGANMTIPDQFSLIEMVNGAIDLTNYLVERLDSVNSLLEQHI